MLRLFRDELGVLLEPGKVLLTRSRASGWKSRAIAQQAVTVEHDDGGWAAAVETLDSALEADTWSGTRVRVVVANRWVRYELMPWSPELSRESERLAHARYLLETTYGDTEEWAVALSDGAPGAPRLVSATPNALVAALGDTLAKHGLRLVSLQPQVVAAFNFWRRQLPSAAAWFATIDDSSLVALHVRDGKCDRVRAVRISDNWLLEFKRIQTIGRLAEVRPAEGPVFIDAPKRMRSLAGDATASMHWLEAEPQPSNTFGRLLALREANA